MYHIKASEKVCSKIHVSVYPRVFRTWLTTDFFFSNSTHRQRKPWEMSVIEDCFVFEQKPSTWSQDGTLHQCAWCSIIRSFILLCSVLPKCWRTYWFGFNDVCALGLIKAGKPMLLCICQRQQTVEQ